MPFLRRRVNMGSESDMRRRTQLIDNSNPPSRPDSSYDLPAALTSLPEHAPALTLPPSQPPLPPLPPGDPAARPVTPLANRPSFSFSHFSMTSSAGDRPPSPPIQDETPKTRRFSMLRFRNASDSQLAAKAKLQAASEKPPPLPRRTLRSRLSFVRSVSHTDGQELTTYKTAPEIITTAPTVDFNGPQKKTSRMNLAARIRKSSEFSRVEQKEDSSSRPPLLSKIDRRKSMVASTGSRLGVTFEESLRPSLPSAPAPPAYYDDENENGTTLALPVNRLSESSRSDGSSGDRVYGSTTTTTHTVHTTTTFFKLSRRKQKQPEPLFPIGHLQKDKSSVAGDLTNASHPSVAAQAPKPSIKRTKSHAGSAVGQTTPTPSRPSSVHGLPTSPSQSPALALFNKANPSPATALFRPSSRGSGQSSPTRAQLHLRGRSSTMSSLGRPSPRASVDEHLAPPTARASSSIGRKSFGDLLGLRGTRQNMDMMGGRHGSLTPATPGGSSKNNSLQLARDHITLPERHEDDTPGKYLERLLGALSRSVVAAALSKGTDPFSQSVLRSYMRSFMFFEDPMDMAIRKLLMEAELPKETQQIDRCLQAFANRYHECNPGIYSSPDQAYFIAFSLLILHTDVFNKNNKHKMQKHDYLKNTRGEGIFDEILEVFYDNITYTPFIHVEDDLDINGERIITHKAKKRSIFPNGTPDPAKRVAKEPIDPYTLIIDRKLDILRPNLKDVMHLEEHYSYLGTARSLNLRELQKTFFKTGVLQIVSARSRPDAFMSEKTATNPEEAHPGIVDIKITKVGLLWRKDVKKKKTRSPWQEWGAILTGAQLYFFRNTPWVKNLMHQYDEHIKRGHDGDPCYFKPPLEHFKPDALMSTDGAVALLDSTYKKHKHAFVYVRHGGFEEVLLAENDAEMNDWLAKLNYAAAFRSSGVRMRGVVGGALDGQGRRAIRRLDADNVQPISTPTGDVLVARSRVDHKMAQDILAARRDIMLQKVADANEKLEAADKNLELQLRNARHLQLLAPIQPKTRDQMLLSAAKMAAQLKWSRIEIWRMKCHRDILLMDLEEERQQLGLPKPLAIPHPAAGSSEKGVTEEPSRDSDATPVPQSPKSPARLSLTRSSTVKSADDSPSTDVFQTPPQSATAPSFHKKHNSWELPALAFDRTSFRKTSVSSVVSSHRSITATPPRKIGSSGSSPEKPKAEKVKSETEEVDAEERDLLEQEGLIGSASAVSDSNKPSSSGLESDDLSERRDLHHHHGSVGNRGDRGKVRRSLQRTLREGAGHLSHHRSKRGKDAVSNGNPPEDVSGEANDQLSRGSGSFVVHGKKASVITFGNELQILTPNERLQQRKASQSQSQALSNRSEEPPQSPHGVSQSYFGAVASSSSGAEITSPTLDFRAILTSDRDREGRQSAASASTATARSFRELRRKYSSAHKNTSNGNLVVPSDEDSDAAISFSEGRHTPLPPIEGGSEQEEEDGNITTEDYAEHVEDVEGSIGEPSVPLSSNHQEREFFTPEPPSPALVSAGIHENSIDGRDETPDHRVLEVEGGERLPSPPLQSVSA